ncbi:MAG: SDR family oxidoreductase [Rhodospirillales bacterium]|nr:SDR family oxidoreductase [Rhodospirillales bacterium]
MTSSKGLMAGKKGLVMGVANDRSIAWGIAKTLSRHGAELAFTYQGEALGKRVAPLAASVGSTIVEPCDVEDAGSVEAVFAVLKRHWDRLDFVVHAVAYSDKDQLKGRYLDTSEDNFSRTMAVSCFSFTAVARGARDMMTDGGSLLTLTFSGSRRVMPSYNVMGVAKAALEASVRALAVDLGPANIRVNALSPGPMRTLAGSAIAGARHILRWAEQNAPLRRTLSLDDVGGAALYLLSDLSTGVTGETHHADAGYNVIGMPGMASRQR